MKQSAGEAGLSSKQEEPLDTADNVTYPPFPDNEVIDAYRESPGFAVQPTQAGLGLESHNFQEQPNVEEGAIQPMQPMQAGLGIESHSFQEQPNVGERGRAVVQPTQAALPYRSTINPPFPDSEVIDAFLASIAFDMENRQREAFRQEEEAENQVVPQTPPSDTNDLRNVLGESEEEAGINDRVVPQAPPVDTNNLRNDGLIELVYSNEPFDVEEDINIQAQAGPQQMHDGPPQQGTAGRRMRLQVPLCCSEELSESKCVSAPSSERACMCGGMLSDQEAEFLSTELADLLCEDANCSPVCSGDCGELFKGRSSGLTLYLPGIATLTLIFLCLFCNFCRLTRTAVTSL